VSDRPFEIVQKVYNAVDTAESAWTAYKDACVPEYDIAYELHGTALKQSRLNITNREEQGWKVLSLILGSALGAWVPKILNPVGNGIDNLTAGWVQTALKHIATEDLKDGIKGTTLDTMKKLGTADTGTAFEPVSEKTTRWGPRMGEGISNRAVQLKRALLEVQDAGRITVAAALKMEDAFRRRCPFVVDQPSQQDMASKQKFRNDSELQMWAEWALARNRKWWRENSQHSVLWDMYPIMNRMFALGVDVSFYHPGRRSGTLGGTWIRPGYVLDMVKMIDWAMRRTDEAAEANSCKLPRSYVLEVQQNYSSDEVMRSALRNLGRQSP
jgi:hypothetical protein